MRIAVICNDTRGGVQPYVALALGLQRSGHEVWAVVPREFASMFTNATVSVASLSGSTDAAFHANTRVAEQGAIATMRFTMRELPARIHAWTSDTLTACEGVDIITGGVGGTIIGLSVAEKLKCHLSRRTLRPSQKTE